VGFLIGPSTPRKGMCGTFTGYELGCARGPSRSMIDLDPGSSVQISGASHRMLSNTSGDRSLHSSQ